MVRLCSLILFLATLYFIEIDAVNYCDSNLCKPGLKNIACNNNGSFSKHCPKNAKMVNLKKFQSLILKVHNSKRNLIASGKLKGYKAATRMALMQWDDELAHVASFNVKRCLMKHDQCRNTPTFKSSGQNLAMISYSGSKKSKTNKQLIKSRVNAWWNEYKNCKMSYIDKYPSNYSGPDIGHFTVFVAEKNIRVGCAAVRYTIGQNHNFLIACNYATTNIVGKPIYVAGTAGKGCTTGRNKVYKSLCSKNEKYDGL